MRNPELKQISRDTENLRQKLAWAHFHNTSTASATGPGTEDPRRFHQPTINPFHGTTYQCMGDLKIDYKKVGYHQRCELFKLQTLYARRNVCDLVYLHKVLNNQVNCSYIVGEILISAPERRQRHIT